MNKIASALAVGLLVAAMVPATTLAGSGAAQGPTAASGTWDDCNTNPRMREVGPNLIVTVHIIESYSGTLHGTYIGTERDVVYADGTATFTGSGTFSGMVDGLSGTGRMRYEGAVGTSGVMPATGPHSGKWVLIGEGGALRGVMARGDWGASSIGTSAGCQAGLYGGDYSGQVVTR